MVIKGSVEEVFFHNDANGYTVISLGADAGLVTAVGTLPNIQEGEYVVLEGQYITDPKYGYQFKFSDFEITRPEDTYSIARYLASGLFRGIGEKTAERIVLCFGKDTLNVLADSPEKLAKIKGITKARAIEIHDEYVKNGDMRSSIMFLQKFDISTGLAIKIYTEYGADTIAVIKENPYRLIEDIDGVGFAKADQIAFKMGIEKDSIFRLKAGVLHILKEAERDAGHTYLPKEMLLNEAAQLLDFADSGALQGVLEELQMQGFIIETDKVCCEEPHRAVTLKKDYLLENSIALQLIKRLKADVVQTIDVDGEIDLYEKTHGIVLHDLQKQAVKTALSGGCTIISGGPGTGKTTIIKCLCWILRGRQKGFELAAPTGRAAKRITETTGEAAKTVHRLLGVDFKTGSKSFLHNEHNPLDADVVIVDEISMADVFIFNALIKALRFDTKLILVGDRDQLPSVSAGNILGDLIASELIPSVFLSFIYRQAETSLIITNAHRINEGKMPILDNNSKDFFFDEKSDKTQQIETVVSMVKDRLPAYTGLCSADIQVLAPAKRGVSGVGNLNIALQNALNPNGRKLNYGEAEFREGDRVMHIKNNYEKQWLTEYGEPIDGDSVGVFNGDMGVVFKVRSAESGSEELVVKYEDGKFIDYKTEDLKELMLAYAVSVHKSQGSEFPAVIIVLNAGSPMLLTKNLLYTAVTRARDFVVIIGDAKVLYRMIKTDSAEKRYTLLVDLLKDWDKKLEGITC